MEHKLNGIFELLQTGKMSSVTAAPMIVDAPPLDPPTSTPKANEVRSNNGINAMLHVANDIPTTSRWNRKRIDTSLDAIDRNFLTFEQADALLESYRPYPANFPFVVIMPHQSLEVLRRDNSFLLLAILAVSSIRDLKLQARLDAELRESLSQRVIINGEKSLDILQGLLVYLTWCVIIYPLGCHSFDFPI